MVGSDHLDRAVNVLNASVHDTTGYTPNELWSGDDVMRRIALERTNAWRQRKNAKVRGKHPLRFELGMKVLVRDQDPKAKSKFVPKWKGPFVLKERISNTMWRAEPLVPAENLPGRPPVWVFHHDQIQPYHGGLDEKEYAGR